MGSGASKQQKSAATPTPHPQAVAETNKQPPVTSSDQVSFRTDLSHKENEPGMATRPSVKQKSGDVEGDSFKFKPHPVKTGGKAPKGGGESDEFNFPVGDLAPGEAKMPRSSGTRTRSLPVAVTSGGTGSKQQLSQSMGAVGGRKGRSKGESPTKALLLRASDKLQKMMDPDPQEELTGLQRLVHLLSDIESSRGVDAAEVALLKRTLLNGQDLHVPVTLTSTSESEEFYSRYDDVTATWLRDMFVGGAGGSSSAAAAKTMRLRSGSGELDQPTSRQDSLGHKLSASSAALLSDGPEISPVSRAPPGARVPRGVRAPVQSIESIEPPSASRSVPAAAAAKLASLTSIPKDDPTVLSAVVAAAAAGRGEGSLVGGSAGEITWTESSGAAAARGAGALGLGLGKPDWDDAVPERWWELMPSEFDRWRKALLGGLKGQGVGHLEGQLGRQVFHCYKACSSASHGASGYEGVGPCEGGFESGLDQAMHQHSFDSVPLMMSHQHPLTLLVGRILEESGLVDRLGISRPKLLRFLFLVEEGYPDPRRTEENPYHNRAHAMDVVQATWMLAHQGGLREHIDDLELLAMIIAAAVHDFRHPGLNNDFLMRTSTRLAITYNDRSVLENHHLASAFELMLDDSCNFIGAMDDEEKNRFRRLVIDLVLSTDLKRHFELLSQFRLKISTLCNVVSWSVENAAPEAGGDKGDGGGGGGSADMMAGSFGRGATLVTSGLQLDEATRVLAMQIGLKCADLSHLTKTRDVHVRWVVALQEEFCRQGDLELEMGLEPSPLNKRGRRGVVSSQVGFFEVIVLPLFRTWAMVFDDFQPVLEAVEANYRYWKDLDMPHAE